MPRFKTLLGRAHLRGRARWMRAPRKRALGPAGGHREARMWSLLLPPRYPVDRQ